jgi:hypothetical protein
LSPVPSYVHAALVNLNWLHALEEEFASLITNNTYDLVPHPIGSNVITDKLIFKHKFYSDGFLECYKARWGLHSFTQQLDVDYDETFSLVLKLAMVRTVLFLAISRCWPIHEIDVKNVFLHGTLLEAV